MNPQEFCSIVKNKAAAFLNFRFWDRGEHHFTPDDISVVWDATVLQNHLAVAVVPLHPTLFFEFTYDGDKDELRMDIYMKTDSVCTPNAKAQCPELF